MTLTYEPRGRYFEEFTEGQQIVTAGRTVTELHARPGQSVPLDALLAVVTPAAAPAASGPTPSRSTACCAAPCPASSSTAAST